MIKRACLPSPNPAAQLQANHVEQLRDMHSSPSSFRHQGSAQLQPGKDDCAPRQRKRSASTIVQNHQTHQHQNNRRPCFHQRSQRLDPQVGGQDRGGGHVEERDGDACYQADAAAALPCDGAADQKIRQAAADSEGIGDLERKAGKERSQSEFRSNITLRLVVFVACGVPTTAYDITARVFPIMFSLRVRAKCAVSPRRSVSQKRGIE
jgi:hypothetical protein